MSDIYSNANKAKEIFNKKEQERDRDPLDFPPPTIAALADNPAIFIALIGDVTVKAHQERKLTSGELKRLALIANIGRLVILPAYSQNTTETGIDHIYEKANNMLKSIGVAKLNVTRE